MKVWMFLLAMTLPDVSPKIISTSFTIDDDINNNNTMNEKQETVDTFQISDFSNEKPLTG